MNIFNFTLPNNDNTPSHTPQLPLTHLILSDISLKLG